MNCCIDYHPPITTLNFIFYFVYLRWAFILLAASLWQHHCVSMTCTSPKSSSSSSVLVMKEKSEVSCATIVKAGVEIPIAAKERKAVVVARNCRHCVELRWIVKVGTAIPSLPAFLLVCNTNFPRKGPQLDSIVQILIHRRMHARTHARTHTHPHTHPHTHNALSVTDSQPKAINYPMHP